MKGFSFFFFSPFCTKFLQCGWKVSPVCEFPEKSGLWTLRPSSLGGAGQVADPQERPSKLVREGESQAHLHLGPASPTCALGQGACQLDHSMMAWRTQIQTEPLARAAGSFHQSCRAASKQGVTPRCQTWHRRFQNHGSTITAHLLCARLFKTCQYDLSFAASSGHKRWGVVLSPKPQEYKDSVSYSLVAAASVEAKADPRVWAWSPASPTSQKSHCLR